MAGSIAESIVSSTVPLSGSGGGSGGGMLSGLMSGFAAGGPIGGLASMVLGGLASSAAARAQKLADQRKELGDLYKSSYNKALDDWYARKGNLEKRKALENYNQFNTMDQIAPGYKDVYQPAALEAMPDAKMYVAGNNKKTKKKNYEYQKTAAAAGQGTVVLPGG